MPFLLDINELYIKSYLQYILFCNRTRSVSQDDVTSGSPRVRDFNPGGLFNPFPLSSKMHSSDSEYSGSDVDGGGQAARLRSHNSKIRHCALACFHTVIKVFFFQSCFHC